MLPHYSRPLLSSGSAPRPPDRAIGAPSRFAHDRIWRCGAVTLVETMCSLFILALFMLGFLSTMIQSRRITEANVLQSAATSMIYGIIEQLKGIEYSSQMPAYNSATGDYYVLVRIDQDTDLTFKVRYTPSTGTPKAPTTCPATTAAKADVGLSPGAIDNFTGDIPMSTVTGTASQKLNLTVWIWIDEIPDATKEATDVKRVTVVYTYSFNDGSSVKEIRDMEVMLRTQYDL